MNKKSFNNLDAKAREIASSCACFKLRKASRAVTQYYDAALEECGLKVTQLTLLVALSLAGPVPIGTLAEELVMDRTTLTRNVELLVRDGFAEVVPGKDKRMKLLQSPRRVELSWQRPFHCGKRHRAGWCPDWASKIGRTFLRNSPPLRQWQF